MGGPIVDTRMSAQLPEDVLKRRWDVVEGWILVDRAGAVWLVKGYEHPDVGFVVQRYPHGRRGSPRGLAVSMYLDCTGREVDVLRLADVARAVDPALALKSERLPGQLQELLDVLQPSWAGLTGSRALGLASATSDYDLLIYDADASRIYRALRDLAEDGLVGECEPDLRASKVADTFGRREFELLHPLKLLDSCYKGVPYTIRILASERSSPCSSRFSSLGWVEGLLEVEDASRAYLTPSRYGARLSGLGDVVLYTWRTRYQELPAGQYYVVALAQRNEDERSIYLVPDIGGVLRPAALWRRPVTARGG